MPRRSATPGRNPSTKALARSMSRWTIARPWALFRSTDKLSFPSMTFAEPEAPPKAWRMGSPDASSSLMTRAPSDAAKVMA
jgi:hypothetical protein